jgi:hypothetical protein
MEEIANAATSFYKLNQDLDTFTDYQDNVSKVTTYYRKYQFA